MSLMSRSNLLLLLGVLEAVLLVPTALGAAATCTSTDPCAVDCTGCTAGDKVPNPRNCRGFFLCLSATGIDSHPFECAEGQVFDAETHECIDGASCDACPQECFYECSTINYLQYTSSVDSCGEYTPCKGPTAGTTKQCDPMTPFFDGLTCQTDESRCCHCRPYCKATDVGYLIADPQDCRRYYACTAEGPTTISGSCPDGQNFSPSLGDCSLLALCNTQRECENVVDVDGCIDPFTCQVTGFFAKCPEQCTPEYYACVEATGKYQEAESCPTGQVFHPDSHTCVGVEQCP